MSALRREGEPADGDLLAALRACLPPERVLHRRLDRVAYASDASFYRLLPRAVVQPMDVAEVRGVLDCARRFRVPVTFRAAGTSLSGQAVGDGLLVELARGWKRLTVEDGGARVRLEPGVVGARVNAALLPWGRRMGPDPASIDACMMGGILANNASGMCCGVAENAYHTLDSLTCVLADGTVVDTGTAGAAEHLADAASDVASGLAELRRRVLADGELAARIRAKYRTKNTTGYSLNALVDHAEPHRILERLLIGSEGTLAFIAEAVLHTLPAYPHRHTGLLLFADVARAAAAVEPLADAGARAVELMDRASLAAVESQAGAPSALRELPPAATALLVEVQAATADDLAALRRTLEQTVDGLYLLTAPRLTGEAVEQAALWKLRKGLYPSIGAARRLGTAVIIEDVAFPRPRLADAVVDLQRLFADHGYDDAIVFGHAKDGNLHFVLTQSFNEADEVRRYEGFMAALVELVVGRYDGALKAEHGTGRNVAPFVETEWGGAALAVMRDVKALLDPDGLLNPGVLLNDDPRCHVEDLKDLPRADPEIDRCIECGFCELKCPSRRLTTTPRQRIAVRREMARLSAAGDRRGLAELQADWPYAGLDTCAADGLCATACPVDIDTGALVKRLRAEGAGRGGRWLAGLLAARPRATETALRTVVRLGHLGQAMLGVRGMAVLTGWLHRVSGHRLPTWGKGMPRLAPARLPRAGDANEKRKNGRSAAEPASGALAASRSAEGDGAGAAAAELVYVPSCLGRVLGVPADGGPPLVEVVVELGRRAGIAVRLPADCRGACCGMPFASKGFPEAATETLGRWVEGAWRWSDEGRLPVVVDAASCAHHLKAAQNELAAAALSAERSGRLAKLRILDAVEWVHDDLLPRLAPVPRPGRAVLHPTCATRKQGLRGKLEAVAARCIEEAAVPADLDCCATAGDRGLLYPELSASALAAEAAEIAAAGHTRGYSTNLTCEIGLGRHTGLPFRSFLYLVEAATRGERQLSDER